MDPKQTRILSDIRLMLVIMVIPLLLYLLKILSFIFIPLVAAIFLALLFMPLMRFLGEKGIPHKGALVISTLLILLIIYATIQLISLSAQEITGVDPVYWENMQTNIDGIVQSVQASLGVPESERGLDKMLKSGNLSSMLSSQAGGLIKMLNSSLSMTLMTLFFLILLIAGSLNVEKLMHQAIFKKRIPSIKTYIQIEKSIVKFIIVKFWLSLFTGIGFTLSCFVFGVEFPIFWGLFTFGINFVQMIGSFISVILVSLFALAQLDTSGSLALFVLCLISTQVLFGGILEPIFMGKTFSLNTITVLVMLMFWGFLWGIPGLILSIPVTVLIKIILERLPKTKKIANIMS